MCDETYTCVCTSKCNTEICKTKCNGGVAFTFANEADYDTIDEGDVLKISNLHQLAPGKAMMVENVTKKTSFAVNHALSQLDIDILMAGGRLNYIKMGK